VRATDLRRDPASLARLREKLFLLWGDLLERKEEEQQQQQQEQREQRVSEAPAQGEESVEQPQQQDLLLPSGRPFGCLVKEYGVPVREGAGWQRVFAMFGTSIVSD
jgi:protection of telomeres protein 1